MGLEVEVYVSLTAFKCAGLAATIRVQPFVARFVEAEVGRVFLRLG